MQYSRHIAFVTPGFAQDEADTICTPYLQTFFRGLQAARPDWRISIIALQYPYRRGHSTWHGLDVWSLGGRNRRWMKPLVWQGLQHKLLYLHKQQPIDLIHAFWIGEAAQGALRFGKPLRIPVVGTLMGQDALPQNRYLRKLDLKTMHVIALSPFSEDLYTQSTHRAADAVIPFGLEPSDIDHRASADRPIDILGVGSLIAAKRPDRFVRVVRMLCDRWPDLRAVLVGQGPEQARLARLIAASGLEQHIQLVSSLPRDEVLALMSQSKVFLHTSNVEGMGLVLAEAMARGCHLVSTPVGVAAAADKCLLSVHTYGLAECAAHFLQFPVDWQPRTPYPIAATIDGHLACYARAWDAAAPRPFVQR